MSAHEKDTVDAAIDRVASRMVAVPDDPDMVLRIVSALPDRSSRLGWLIPQFAALGALVIAAVIWSTREQPITPTVLPSTEIAAVAAFPIVTAREPRPLVSTQLLKRLEPLEPVASFEPGDFDRSLPALEVAEALELNVIGPAALPVTEALTLAPIEIGELPLTAATLSPDKS